MNRAVDLAAELVRLKVDIIVVAGGSQWIRATQNTTKIIPIIMVGVGADPVEGELVESLARPGGNITGLTFLNRELGGKRLELLKEAVPKLARVARGNGKGILDCRLGTTDGGREPAGGWRNSSLRPGSAIHDRFPSPILTEVV
ncbi:MAG TPA: ABC transporter substrate binding protein [Pyrinomonadaceae bacterium]|nr:ABC transporter substrate binding protein [Pyrinomonadaceae bacterium]